MPLGRQFFAITICLALSLPSFVRFWCILPATLQAWVEVKMHAVLSIHFSSYSLSSEAGRPRVSRFALLWIS